MSTCIKLKRLPREDILTFARKHNLILVCREEPSTKGGSCYVTEFEHVGITENGMYSMPSGHGKTIEESIENYARKISNKMLVFGRGDNRRVIKAPCFTSF